MFPIALLAKGLVGYAVKKGAKQYAKAFPKTILGSLLGGAAKQALPIGVGVAAGAALTPSGGGLPALPALKGTMLPSQFPSVGMLPAWRGPGGKLQLPWNDPRIPQFLKQFSLDDAYLRPYYRAPKGYVVLRDENGKPFACMKQVAKQFGLWRAKAKPPISIRDWHSFQRAKRVEKKLVKIARSSLSRRSRGGFSRGSCSASASARAKR